MSGHRQRLRAGIDIGGTAIKLAAICGGHAPICRSSDSYARPSRGVLERRLRRSWRDLLREAGANAEAGADAQAVVGLCIAGPLGPDGVLEAAANLPAMVGVQIGVWAQNVLELARPPRVLTDALAAALGEHRANPLRGRVLYLALGAGVGGVVLDDGRPLLVTRGTTGHFGHIDVSGGEKDAPATAAAGRGALEAYIGAEALRRAGVDLDTPAGLRHPALAAALAALARGLRILLALYRPEHIVLLGGIGLKLRPVLSEVEAQVRDRLTVAAPAHFTLACGRGGYFAAALGAAAAAGRRSRGAT
jgi:predicted NBD/HSP70 family sugar kinase